MSRSLLKQFGKENGVLVVEDMHPDRSVNLIMVRGNDSIIEPIDEAHLEEQLERLLWDLNSRR